MASAIGSPPTISSCQAVSQVKPRDSEVGASCRLLPTGRAKPAGTITNTLHLDLTPHIVSRDLDINVIKTEHGVFG